MSDDRARSRLLERSTRALARARTALERPTEMVESTRWLFWLLAMISLALSSTAALAQGRGPMMPVALVAAAALAASLTAGYLHRSAVWQLDVLDAAAILALACSSPSPAAVFAVLFAVIWFRSLSGSTGGALLRCTLYAGMMVLTLPLFPRIPGSTGPADTTIVLSSIPPMFVNFVLARHLFNILRNVAQGAERDAIHAAAGSRLLGITDPSTIKQITWQAISDICAATPGLRVLGVRPLGNQLEVVLREGDVTTMPNLLYPRTRWALEAEESGVTGLSDLDAAVGSPHEWQSLQVHDPTVEGWLVVGTRRRVPTQAVDTVAGVVALSVLALRNSQAHRELTAQATLDNLTGLANRKLFNTTLSEVLAHAKRAPGNAQAKGTETAVLFVDLDDFKDVNDLYGHSGGDELLREVSARITAATRSEDLCARLGGDEFAVLLPGTGAAEATDVARRIVDAVGGPVELTDGVAQVSASVGLAVDAGDLTPEQLVQRADIAMYAAKAGGKGRMQLFTVGLLQDGPGSARFENQLETATSNDELVVHYQPIVSLSDGRCTAVEALVRWQHPQRGLLHPADFLAVAERTGAILDIGRFVLRRACADATDWRRCRAGAPLALHVNVSARQLDDETFGADVLRCLEEFSFPPDELVLEVTETSLLSSPRAVDVLTDLAAHGVVIAIDDFGTGYSALTTLRSLPVSVVKIDASFVAGVTVNGPDRAVAEAVVQMASRMGMRTIAEGVERPDQQALLESIGADAAQGYLYLRPAPVADLLTWLERRDPAADSPDDVVVPFSGRHTSGRSS